MPAVPPYIIEPIWEQFCALLPEHNVDHPLGCHRTRIPDKVVFERHTRQVGIPRAKRSWRNFRGHLQGRVPGIHLLGTSVNKPGLKYPRTKRTWPRFIITPPITLSGDASHPAHLLRFGGALPNYPSEGKSKRGGTNG